MKKVLSALCCTLLLTTMFWAQEADDWEEDDFFLDLSEDLTYAISDDEEGGAVTGGRNRSSILQGIWIETVSHTDAIIRDLATGEKSGYEIDDSRLKSNANWWFWGDITPTFHLDAEIGVWSFDKYLYRANSWGANAPLVTWTDGLQDFASLAFSPLYNANENSVGSLNKMGFTIQTTAANVRFGYGNLGKNGMSSWTGIYTVLDRWPDVGKGYTEITNGKGWQKIGPFQIDVLAGLSMTRGTYGTYDIASISWNDTVTGAVTFGSYTTQEELFFYNKENKNAASAYISYAPTSHLTIEAHGLKTFGTDISDAGNAWAGAGRFTWQKGMTDATLTVSYAGSEADSVWGAESAPYDNLHADSLTATFDGAINFSNVVTLQLDERFTINETADLTKGLRTLTNQLNLDVNLEQVIDLPVSIGSYALINVDQLSYKTSKRGREIVPYFSEAGIECISEGLFDLNKITLDYAVKAEYSSWKSGNTYPVDMIYHSLMANVDVSDRLSLHSGALIRSKKEADPTLVPFGIAAGFSLKKISMPGNPMLYLHGTYGMNPYSENQYSLYRADNSLNQATHRTYLLNDLNSDTTTSQISIGCIWDLQ